MKKVIKAVIIIALVALLSVSGVKIWGMSQGYIMEAGIKEKLSLYHPGAPGAAQWQTAQGAAESQGVSGSFSGGSPQAGITGESTGSIDEPGRIVNPSIVSMQEQVNADIAGWLTIPETRIDYPFVHGTDNDYYVSTDLNGNHATAGSIFIDYRCAPDFTGSNTIIYGHKMRNGSMFGDLHLFADEWFFNNNTTGTVYLPRCTYSLEIFAYMVVGCSDEMIYDPQADHDALISYARENALNFRQPAAGGSIVTLSACAYSFEGARSVLLGRVS
ncbi:MAG: sortase [Oscillospiraceae bacterium]|nr:sortase [Oscillospiraceae bacterium]